MAKCLQEKKFCQHYEAKLDYGFDWTRTFTRKWEPDTQYDSGIVVRPFAVTTGWQYRSDGGQSGSEEPAWPLETGLTVVDGSITWTAEPYSIDGLFDQVGSDSWTVDDTSLTVEAITPIIDPGQQRTLVLLSGGTPGVVYTVLNELLTANGLEYVARIYLTVTD